MTLSDIKEPHIDKVRLDFPLVQRKARGKPIIYLDNAATTLKPKSVSERVANYYLLETANIHRGVHFLSEQGTKAYEDVREKVRQFLNIRETAEIIFTSGTTDSINLLAHSYGRAFIKEGDEIIISHMEHHSNIVPWQLLCEEKGCVLKVAPINDAGELEFDEFEKLLGPKTALVSMVYVSNILGTVNPVKKVIEAAHAYDVPVLIDAAQTVSHMPVDVQELDCDFLAFSAHKILGPTGSGVLYGKRKFLDKMPPYRSGGDMISSVSFEKTTFNKLPYKFEAGTPHMAGVIGLGAALDYIQSIGWDFIMNQEEKLLDYATEGLKSIDGLTIIGTAKHKASLISFVLDQIHPHDIGTLVDQEGVAIRTGHHCAQPVMDRFGIPATARASFAFYNNLEDVDRLLVAIEKVKDIFQ